MFVCSVIICSFCVVGSVPKLSTSRAQHQVRICLQDRDFICGSKRLHAGRRARLCLRAGRGSRDQHAWASFFVTRSPVTATMLAQPPSGSS
eukprot:3904669-Prymnesium_polylepis.1